MRSPANRTPKLKLDSHYGSPPARPSASPVPSGPLDEAMTRVLLAEISRCSPIRRNHSGCTDSIGATPTKTAFSISSVLVEVANFFSNIEASKYETGRDLHTDQDRPSFSSEIPTVSRPKRVERRCSSLANPLIRSTKFVRVSHAPRVALDDSIDQENSSQERTLQFDVELDGIKPRQNLGLWLGKKSRVRT